MYAINRLTHEFLEKHPKIFGMFQPCFLMLCGNSPHSYDNFRRVIFFGEKNAAAFLIADKDTNKIKAVIVFHQFEKENESAFMHLIPVGEEGFDSKEMTTCLKPFLADTFKKLALFSIRSNVLGIEEQTKTAIEGAGFQKEAELKEQIYAGGRLDSVLIYALFAKDFENA